MASKKCDHKTPNSKLLLEERARNHLRPYPNRMVHLRRDVSHLYGLNLDSSNSEALPE